MSLGFRIVTSILIPNGNLPIPTRHGKSGLRFMTSDIVSSVQFHGKILTHFRSRLQTRQGEARACCTHAAVPAVTYWLTHSFLFPDLVLVRDSISFFFFFHPSSTHLACRYLGCMSRMRTLSVDSTPVVVANERHHLLSELTTALRMILWASAVTDDPSRRPGLLSHKVPGSRNLE
jgi:hypothetical protein